jgi:hypothetical protein
VLENLIEKAEAGDGYSYNFQGSAQALDHILATEGLFEQAELDYVHVNADFPSQASDHEPVLARFTFAPEREVIAGTDGNDVLVGTDADERLMAGGGRFDRLTGGEGSDEFVFGQTASNGIRETATITDFMPGEDVLDLSGAEVLQEISAGPSLYLVLEGGDFDTLILRGVQSFDDLALV